MQRYFSNATNYFNDETTRPATGPVADFRSGSEAPFWAPVDHFRSAPNSGHSQCPSACRKRDAKRSFATKMTSTKCHKAEIRRITGAGEAPTAAFLDWTASVIARSASDEAIQTAAPLWIASRSLSSGARSRGPSARNDVERIELQITTGASGSSFLPPPCLGKCP
jgi:hypothetical protein